MQPDGKGHRFLRGAPEYIYEDKGNHSLALTGSHSAIPRTSPTITASGKVSMGGGGFVIINGTLWISRKRPSGPRAIFKYILSYER
jgi:hypothetical protein